MEDDPVLEDLKIKYEKSDEKLKEKVKTVKLSESRLSEEITNSKTLEIIEAKHITVANASASGLSNPMLYQLQPSMVSYWNPNITKSS